MQEDGGFILKTALITGITGQDGSYLAEFLLEKGYKVYGMYRRTSTPSFERIKHIKDNLELLPGDMIDSCSIERVVKTSNPDEVYNMAAMSQVGLSFKMPHLTREVNYHGVIRLLYALKKHSPKAKFYQASSSEIFGNVDESPQNEQTPYDPVSPYAKSKRDAHVEIVNKIFREKHDMFAVGGIAFNHSSPRRGKEFVTGKIAHYVAKIKLGLTNKIILGNLKAKRDWGYARDYIKGMWLMLQREKPEDFVLATGKSNSVKEFLESSFNCVDIDYEKVDLSDKGENEADKYIEEELENGGPYVVIHPRFFRPVEVHDVVGDASKAKKKLGWEPKTTFENLVELMIKSEIERLQ